MDQAHYLEQGRFERWRNPIPRRIGKVAAALFGAFLIWNLVLPYLGRHWLRETVASGSRDGLSYTIEAHRFQGDWKHNWHPVGVTIQIRTAKWGDEANYRIDFNNMSVDGIEFAKIVGDRFYLNIRFTQFQDSLSGSGSYQLLFDRKSGTMRSCGNSAIPAEADCAAIIMAAPEMFR